ncbi:putative sterol carrier protein [Evansella vedderi]|uniref:Sterol carrier protein n=1 Tax=Evansella vedderi TaxID=38282 RepID=A0ABT9ZRV0_9BACI|nr:SCP2 sterol-binding domain-containing protein [Evansella vedderi]MDQ0253964.1 putative sterol carrier protein [Evansella vedderi]
MSAQSLITEGGSTMGVKEKFYLLTEKINEDPSHLEGLDVVYQFNLDGEDGGIYQLKLSGNSAEYTKSEDLEPKITIKMNDKNFLKLAEGDLNPTVAYMSGKLKVQGDLALALKLNYLLKQYQS